MNPKVDTYLAEGCGRCSLVNTPQCKVNTWPEELKELRRIILDCGLTEELKWSQPCYTYQKSNVVLMGAFKEYSALSFFKGALLKDVNSILQKPGENSQAARQIRFTDVQAIVEMEPILKAYIHEAIEVEKAGLKVDFKKKEHSIPEELQNTFDESPAFKTAFEALTPGRQRGYILHFSAAKQSKTRASRIEKYMPRIFDGIGFWDCTCGHTNKPPNCDGTHKHFQ
ncbi:MAG: YdeI/OmpD-associated family protein [Gammaproteobacteria bacterium]